MNLIERIVELAGIARKDGMMALEGQETPDPFFDSGLQMLVDGADESKLTIQLKKELKAMQVSHEKNIGCAQSWVDIAPAMGMIGTLVGLVAMLGKYGRSKGNWTSNGSCSTYNFIWCDDSKYHFYAYCY